MSDLLVSDPLFRSLSGRSLLHHPSTGNHHFPAVEVARSDPDPAGEARVGHSTPSSPSSGRTALATSTGPFFSGQALNNVHTLAVTCKSPATTASSSTSYTSSCTNGYRSASGSS